MQNRGGNGIVKLSKNTSGVLVGTRNIILGLNIPHYK
jgi:protocatechuate 3,4-dioxygenase, beta subunit